MTYITVFIIFIIITGVSLECHVAGISHVAGGHFIRVCAEAIKMGQCQLCRKNRLPVLNRSNMAGTDSQFAQVN